MRCLLCLLALATCAVACSTEPSPRDVEVARVRGRLERVEAELVARSVDDLGPAQRRERAAVLDHLHDYIVAERYPTNDIVPYLTPIFIDDGGVRCAMAAVIEASGHRDLVERIARDHDYAYIDDLRDDAELRQWLTDHGISLDEAARIQPSYSNATATHWQPTISAEVGGGLGNDDGGGPGWLSLGARLGVRRVVHSAGACDHCVHRSTALVGEYQHLDVPGRGAVNQVGLLFQFDDGRDYQGYLLGGPVAAIGSAGVDRVGGQLGWGLSLRNRPLPVFGELTGAVLAEHGDAVVRAGLLVGVVW